MHLDMLPVGMFADYDIIWFWHNLVVNSISIFARRLLLKRWYAARLDLTIRMGLIEKDIDNNREESLLNVGLNP